ncbi:MAG: hypothetical protein ACK4K0_07675 [Flavobacteriales bacterium]
MSLLNAQLLDFNHLFKSRMSIESTTIQPYNFDSLSLTRNAYRVSALIPLKSKFDVGVSLKDFFNKDILKKDGLKNFIGKVEPTYHQWFLKLDGGVGEYFSEGLGYRKTYMGSVGVNGITVKLKKLKLRTSVYGATLSTENTFDINPFPRASAVYMRAKVKNLNTIYAYGLYAAYFNGRVVASPVLFVNGKITSNLNYTLLLPAQAKITWKASKNWKQDILILSAQGYPMTHSDAGSNPIYYTETGLRLSTQSRIRIKKRVNIYSELGWQGFSQYHLRTVGENTISKTDINPAFFGRLRISVNFGKALISSSFADFDI